jgi:hypothetical protein
MASLPPLSRIDTITSCNISCNPNEKLSYRCNGKIDFFGDRVVARSNGVGARLNPFAPTHLLSLCHFVIPETIRCAETLSRCFRGFARDVHFRN